MDVENEDPQLLWNSIKFNLHVLVQGCHSFIGHSDNFCHSLNSHYNSAYRQLTIFKDIHYTSELRLCFQIHTFFCIIQAPRTHIVLCQYINPYFKDSVLYYAVLATRTGIYQKGYSKLNCMALVRKWTVPDWLPHAGELSANFCE
jgi:hypothetical protein